jgi:signal peptidase I
MTLLVAVAGIVLAVVSTLVTTREAADYMTWHQQGGAMEPTYPDGSDVKVKSIDGSGVQRGDVVLFSARDWGADSIFMMRVIAVGGDQVVINEPGTVKVNGEILREPYLFKGSPYMTPPVEVTVPEGRLFLLGDHRAAARDSRAYLLERNGTIARSAVVGMAVDHANAPSPDRGWMWVGVATAAAGLIATAVTTTVRRRRTGPWRGTGQSMAGALGRNSEEHS